MAAEHEPVERGEVLLDERDPWNADGLLGGRVGVLDQTENTVGPIKKVVGDLLVPEVACLTMNHVSIPEVIPSKFLIVDDLEHKVSPDRSDHPQVLEEGDIAQFAGAVLLSHRPCR